VNGPGHGAGKATGLFIVWSPAGETPPKMQYATHKEAAYYAHKMAAKHPGQTFFVMTRAGALIRHEPEAPQP